MRDYQFWVIRYVPDSVRGEFVNIGLVVGGSDRDWAFRRVTRLSRARALGGFADAAESWLKRFEVDFISEGTLFAAEGLARPQGRTDLWIEELRRRMQNTIQISRPRPVVGRSAAEVADLLYARLIVDPPLRESSTARFRMANTLESAFTNLGVVTNLDIKRRVLARTGNLKTPFEYDWEATRLKLGGISRSLVFRLWLSGELGSVKVGKRRFSTDRQISDYISRLEGVA